MDTRIKIILNKTRHEHWVWLEMHFVCFAPTDLRRWFSGDLFHLNLTSFPETSRFSLCLSLNMFPNQEGLERRLWRRILGMNSHLHSWCFCLWDKNLRFFFSLFLHKKRDWINYFAHREREASVSVSFFLPLYSSPVFCLSFCLESEPSAWFFALSPSTDGIKVWLKSLSLGKTFSVNWLGIDFYTDIIMIIIVIIHSSLVFLCFESRHT